MRRIPPALLHRPAHNACSFERCHVPRVVNGRGDRAAVCLLVSGPVTTRVVLNVLQAYLPTGEGGGESWVKAGSGQAGKLIDVDSSSPDPGRGVRFGGPAGPVHGLGL